MESWKLHIILHFVIPIVIFFLSIVFIEDPDLSLLDRLIAVLIGSFIPDIDHFIYLKYIRFASFRHFLLFNIKSDRYRRGFLLFHNIFSIVALAILIPFIMFYSSFLSLFLIAFLIHLIFDFFEDRIIIRVVSYWKAGK